MKHYFQVIMLAAFAIGMTACGEKEQGWQQGIESYKVITIPQQDVRGYSSYPASIQGKVTSNVRAKISGYIEKLYVDEGAEVKKGDPLFKLETNTLSEDAGAAKATIGTAEAQVNVAQVNVDKLIPLVEKGIVSDIQLETAKADLASAKSQLATAKASYQSVVANINYSVIKSPIDGVVGTINHRVGSLVSPSDPEPLTVVSEEEEMYAYFSMNEKEYFNLLKVTEGKTIQEKLEQLPAVELILANGEKYEEEGRIATISGQVNRATGAVQIRASFPNENRILSTGYSGTVQIPNEFNDVLVVPESATYDRQGHIYVYKVVNDTVKSTPIEVIERINQLAIVTGGIKKGDTIVGIGLGTLRPNTKIKPEYIDFEEVNKGIDKIF